MRIPEPVMLVAVEPRTAADAKKMAGALSLLTKEDPSLRARFDAESGRTIISGQGESHLEGILERLKREFVVEALAGKPRIAYRETVRKAVVEEAQFIRQMDGRGHYARCVLRIEPLPTGKGFEFNDDVRGRIPSEYVPAVVEGVREALSEGVLAGYPIVDVKVDLIDGSYHDIDSNVAAFRTAGAMALRSGCEKAEPIILEPIMECEVLVPDQYADAAVGDLNSRRARIFAVGDRAELKSIKCSVPLSEMFGYPDLLRSLTNGRGSFSMRASHFEEIPRDHYKAIIDPHTGDDPPAAPAGRPVRPIRPRPGLSGGGSRPIPPDSD